MAEVTAQMVKELRERTQAGMSDCKSALVEASGDMEKSVELILKKGLAKSAKRAGAVATEGEVRTLLSEDGKKGVLVEVNIQTDFAARNDKFTNFVGQVASIALGTKTGEDLTAQPFPGAGKSLEDVRKELAATIGENIQVRRWECIEISDTGLVHSYVHPGGKIGVLIEIGSDSANAIANPTVRKFADDVAMQIAAMAPLYLERTQVPVTDAERQVGIFKGQLKEEGKPEASWEKIIEGKKNKWFAEVCLTEQDSLMMPGKTVNSLAADVSKEVGGTISLRRFVRFERGEGIEKAGNDFAAEVAKLAGALAFPF